LGLSETDIIAREESLRNWFTQGCDPLQKVIDGLDIGWGGVQRWATARMPPLRGDLHLDVACGYATFLAQLGWRFPQAGLVGLNIDFEGPHALARPLLSEAGVEAAWVQADARRMPFADAAFGSASCFLGLQDIEIGFGEEGVRQALAEAVRVLQHGGVLAVCDEFPFVRFDVLLTGLSLAVTERMERALDVRWDRQVAERAIALYATGWLAQARVEDQSARERLRCDVSCHMAVQMEHQLATQGYFVPFGPLRMVVTSKTDTRGG
jgi:ubiquinone/menaquinone biosynthesis C-methylase UbiE